MQTLRCRAPCSPKPRLKRFVADQRQQWFVASAQQAHHPTLSGAVLDSPLGAAIITVIGHCPCKRVLDVYCRLGALIEQADAIGYIGHANSRACGQQWLTDNMSQAA